MNWTSFAANPQAIGQSAQNFGIAITPDGKTVVAPSTSGSVVFLDAATLRILASVHTGTFPTGVAVGVVASACSGFPVYVTDTKDGTLTVIDASSHKITRTLTIGAKPVGVAVDHSSVDVYVGGDHYVAVVDPTTYTVTKTATPQTETSMGNSRTELRRPDAPGAVDLRQSDPALDHTRAAGGTLQREGVVPEGVWEPATRMPATTPRSIDVYASTGVRQCPQPSPPITRTIGPGLRPVASACLSGALSRTVWRVDVNPGSPGPIYGPCVRIGGLG